MRRWCLRVLLAGVLTPAGILGMARADGPGPVVVAGPGAPVVSADSGLPCGPGGLPGPGADAAGRPHSVADWVHGHKWYCWSHHNNVGCGSLQAEWKYVFSSCREFYGEPCFKSPPPPPTPDGSVPPFPYGPIARGQRRLRLPVTGSVE